MSGNNYNQDYRKLATKRDRDRHFQRDRDREMERYNRMSMSSQDFNKRARMFNDQFEFSDSSMDYQTESKELPSLLNLKELKIRNNTIDAKIFIQNSQKPPVEINYYDDYLNVRFYSFFPNEAFTPGCHVRVIFFNEPTQPILIRHTIEHEQKTCSNGNKYHMITLNTELPYNLKNDSMNIYYFYIIEQNNMYQVENLLLEQEIIRHIDPNRVLSSNMSGKRSRMRGIRDERSLHEKIDGLLLFGDTLSYNVLTAEYILQFKSDILELLIPIEYLTNQMNLTEPERLKKIFNFISIVHKCLCASDKDYLDLFEMILSKNFERILVQLRTETDKRPTEDWECLILLAIFFIMSKFDLKISKNPTALAVLFSMHNVNKEAYLTKLNSIFKLKDTDSNLESELTKFLDENKKTYKLDEGVNALVVFYYCKKSDSSDSYQSLIRMESNRLAKYYLNKPSEGGLIQAIKSYMVLIQSDYMLASLILNYFSPSFENLRDLFQIKEIPVEAYLYYYSFKIMDKHDEFENKFLVARAAETFAMIKEFIYFQIRNGLDKNSAKLVSIHETCYNLLRLLTSKFSKEHETIISLIELKFNIHNLLCGFNMDQNENTKLNECISDGIDNIKQEIQTWFDKEFNESLLINFGIDSRSKQDISENQMLINVYKNFYQYKSNLANLSESDRHFLERFQTPADVKNSITYFGLRNESDVILRLLNMRVEFKRSHDLKTIAMEIDPEMVDQHRHATQNDNLKDLQKFIITSLFKQRILRRIRNRFDEVIQFRIKFDFRKFSTFETEFINRINSIISQHLINSESENELVTLCKCLKDPTNQAHLDFFINELLSNKWPKTQSVYQDIKFALEWPLFIHLISIHLDYQKARNSLPLNNQIWFKKYETLTLNFKNLIENLIKSNEKLEFIKLISQNFRASINLSVFIIENLNLAPFLLEKRNIKYFEILVQTRMKELKEFELYRSNLTKFDQFCRLFSKIKIESIREQLGYLNSLENVDSIIRLNETCQSIDFENQISAIGFNLNTYRPIVNYFKGVDQDFMNIIEEIIRLNRKYCVIFDEYFRESCESISSDMILSQFIKTAWDKTYARWKQIALKIESGNIKLDELDQFLENYFKGDYTPMIDELIYIDKYFKIKNLDLRNKQIDLYKRFKSSYSAACEIENIRKSLNLNNEFEELNDLLSIKTDSYHKWDLNRMDDKVEKTINVLDRINDPQKLYCLTAYSKSLNLVEWLRKNAKSLEELKVLVDLASMSTSNQNEHSASFDRTLFAKALKEAGVAFKSLIYDLKTDVNFYDFMTLSEKVCSHLESDKNIANKLLEVKDKVELLDEIKRMKGNVELNSLKQAKQINEFGVYKIGNLKEKESDDLLIKFNKKLNLSDLIQLEIDGGKKTKVYTFDQLKELQNILMLIAPRKTRNEIDDGETEIRDDGDMLEDQDETETLEYFMEMFSGVIRLSESYLKLIEHSCLFFENFVIKIFCDYDKSESPSKQKQLKTRPKLEIHIQISSDKKPEIIEDTSNKTLDCLNIIYTLMDLTYEQWSNYISNLRDNYLLLNHFNLNQISYLIKALNKLLIKKKLTNQIELEMIFSILYNINASLTKEKIEKAHKESFISFKTESVSFDNLNYQNDQSQSEFSNLFQKAWGQFLNEQNGIGTEFISLKNLSLMLNHLSYEDITETKKREVPGYLNNLGKPNLIICPQNEQIQVILSIYGLSIDQPAPTNNEILFCQQDTTSEEIENFLRIVFKSNGEKIYTLVNIEDLSYDNSSRIEKFLKTYQDKNENFILVFICTQGKESESILASSFLKNRVRPVLLEHNNIETYLNMNLFEKPDKSKFWLKNYDPNGSSVRVLISQRSGNGKSKYIKYLCNKIEKENGKQFNYKILRIKSNYLSSDSEIEKLLNYKLELESEGLHDRPTIYHIDIAYEVFKNVDNYLFSLIVECYLKHSNGLVWRRNPSKDLYLIEITPPFIRGQNLNRLTSIHSMINFLPKIELKTPLKYLYDLRNIQIYHDTRERIRQNFDNLFSIVYKKEKYQRVCFYMKLVNSNRSMNRQISNEVNNFISETTDQEAEAEMSKLFDKDKNLTDEFTCLETIMQKSELVDPNWHEIRNFVTFLNSQLILYEQAAILDQVAGLRPLCLRLLLVVANNFGSPSLNYQEDRETSNRVLESRTFNRQESLNVFEFNQTSLQPQISLNCYEIRDDRKWENLIHPFMIINLERTGVTFIGTHVDRSSKQFINPNTNEPLDKKSPLVPKISHQLFIELLRQRFPLFDNFNQLYRERKLTILSSVMCLDQVDLLNNDPDPNYELTLDNCLKMIAIYLRFVCNIPVVVMGETGCGKTCLVKFFSRLHKTNFENILLHIKVHGGTTALDIKSRLEEAEELSRKNYELIKEKRKETSKKHLITTILFFDEANTTEEVGLIKEIMCDLTCMGRKIDLEHGLKIVAAVNPYRKHSPEMIEKLESAGLGFYVSSSDTKERLGHIPMRQLVYRVQPLPTSLLPIVWDFGQLDKTVESVYISELIKKNLFSPELVIDIETDPSFKLICDLLDKSQSFMRERNDECSFVSIRNIERVIKVTKWFISKGELIFERMNKKTLSENYEVNDYEYQTKLNDTNGLKRSFILSLIVCYHASLYTIDTRRKYRQMIRDTFEDLEDESEKIKSQSDWVFTEMLKCQSVFFDEIDLNKKNIACNLALFENVFMMIICIELRIPLFIVGKPGSSKSLAKTIVSRAMEGRNSKSLLFQNLKETYFVNFQCSPLTTSEMILKAFQEAAKFQESVDIEKSVAVVNLDEIGLAEGSESMPLKALHPLLESGTDSADENVSDHHKVAVVGISNWALDPAKMNRGLFVSRGEPDINELIETAKGICRYDRNVLICIEPYLPDIAEAYLDLCKSARDFKREFFGLRDYYSLVKMIYFFCSKDQKFTWSKLEHAVRRNFSGLEIDNLEPFRKRLSNKLDNQVYETDPKCQPLDLIESALKGEYVESNSRYLLFLTENNSAIDIIQNYLTNMVGVPAHNLSVIFGSSFRLDQQYTEVCRNISLIKHSMEIGKTIILLNSYNLYESLYDALNQYYYEFAGQKYVDLGLGTHRIKCSVHDSFRLVIIAEKSAVYDSKRFPIPLINRLEKHFLNAATMLNSTQFELVNQINSWINNFNQKFSPNLNEQFVGYHSDTIASLVLHLTTHFKDLENDELIRKAKKYLLRCATPDCLIRASSIRQFEQQEKEFMWNEYFSVQKHLSLKELLKYHLNQEEEKNNLIQISTNSKSNIVDLPDLTSYLDVDSIDVCLLQSFDTQHQFLNKLKQFVSRPSDENNLLLIQCDMNLKYSSDLISCARHHIAETYKSLKSSSAKNYFICLVILIPKENVKNFIGFQLGYWSCYHLDEIEDYLSDLPPFESLKNKSLSSLLEEALEADMLPDKMEMEEISETKNLSLDLLFKKLAHSACSLLVDTNLSRTIHRIDLFIKLCDNKEFVRILAKRLISLQSEKENKYMSKDQTLNWLINEVATRKQINQYSTLRRACQNYFDSKLSPLLAFILSIIDLYSNLDTFFDATQNEESNWKADLWLKLLENEDICKIVYSEMRSKEDSGYSKELNSFVCQSQWIKKEFTETHDENKNLKPSLPFFWLLINQLNNLYKNFSESNPTGSEFDLNAYAKIISKFFEENSLYSLLNEIIHDFNEKSKLDFNQNLIDFYIHDFLLINSKISNRKSLETSKKIIKVLINELNENYRSNLKYTLPMVHYVFDKVKPQFDMFLKFSQFDPKLTDASLFKSDSYYTQKHCLSIDLDSCLEAIKNFKKSFTLLDDIAVLDKLYGLLQLISELLISKFADVKIKDQKLIDINEQFQSLTVLKYFCDSIRKFHEDFDHLNDSKDQFKTHIVNLFNKQINLLNNKYLKMNINFKKKSLLIICMIF